MRKTPVALVACMILTATWAGVAHAQLAPQAYPPPGPPPVPNELGLGAVFTTNAGDYRHLLPTADARGALVLAVLPDTPAARAGLSPGDVVVAVDEEEIRGYDRARFLFRSRENPNLSISFVKPDTSARTVSVRLSKPRLAVERYVSDRLAQRPDQVIRYLFARSFAKPGEALRLADQLIQTAPGFAGAHILRARSLVASFASQGGAPPPPNAVSLINESTAKALELDPASPEILALATQIYLGLGSHDIAETTGRRAVDGDPGSAYAHFMLGLTRFASGTAEAALPALHKAVELDPYVAGHYDGLARCYAALGRSADEAATRKALADSRKTNSPKEESIGRTMRTAVGLGAVAGIFGIGVPAIARRRYGGAITVDGSRGPDAQDPSRLLGLVEALGALGIWGMVLPFLGPAFALVPQGRRSIEIVEYFIPGVVVVATTAACLALLVRASVGANRFPRRLLRLAPLVTCLAGLWITSTHVSVVFDAIGGTRSWGQAIFLSTCGPVMLFLSVRLFLSTEDILDRQGDALPHG